MSKHAAIIMSLTILVAGATITWFLQSEGPVTLLVVWLATALMWTASYALILRAEFAQHGRPTRVVRTYYEVTDGMVWRVDMKRSTRRQEPRAYASGPYCLKDRSRLVVRETSSAFEEPRHAWMCPTCDATFPTVADLDRIVEGRATGRWLRHELSDSGFPE